ncbi:hypothetical protein [Yoonia litorea]|uniref:Transferrin-binding protein B C-lobe/N-lobe beta barrel domain-containing protein n=1 Tax=Yoonia litorea TaxID=1123755 RepID=A0A1I6N2D5_9RHOB|nr:hypothetical protein [Yoonia litorea]SFS22103.1 hypothetical protein SAMN05444714_3135 [Yoonia litorea]
MFRVTIPALTLLTAAACASPNPPTVSAADVDRAYAEARYISGLPFTATGDLPTGTVTYEGQLGATVTGDVEGSILGDMTMNVGFASNDVSGDVSNINLIDTDGRPDQRLDGSLGIDGFESAGRIDAFASGRLEAIDDGGFIRESDVLLTLDGDVFDDRSRGDAVFGSAQGNGIGDLEIEVDGVFFGTRN